MLNSFIFNPYLWHTITNVIESCIVTEFMFPNYKDMLCDFLLNFWEFYMVLYFQPKDQNSFF